MDVPSRRWSLLLVGKTNGIVAQVDHDWSKHPDHYEKVVVVEEEHANREIERLRAELAECKMSLGAIHAMVDRVSTQVVRAECERAVPELAALAAKGKK